MGNCGNSFAQSVLVLFLWSITSVVGSRSAFSVVTDAVPRIISKKLSTNEVKRPARDCWVKVCESCHYLEFVATCCKMLQIQTFNHSRNFVPGATIWIKMNRAHWWLWHSALHEAASSCSKASLDSTVSTEPSICLSICGGSLASKERTNHGKIQIFTGSYAGAPNPRFQSENLTNKPKAKNTKKKQSNRCSSCSKIKDANRCRTRLQTTALHYILWL